MIYNVLAKITPDLSGEVIETMIYALLGVIFAALAYFVVDLIIPGKMGKQIAEEKNLPIAVVAGSMILGICIIIAASIAG